MASEGSYKNQTLSFGVTFSVFFNKGKESQFNLIGNSSYLSLSQPIKNDCQVGWNPREVGLSSS